MPKAVFLAAACAGLVLAIGGARADETAPGWAAFEAQIADAKQTMMADPKAALEKARKADALARAKPDSAQQREAVATSLWLEGEALTRVNKIDEAHAAIDKALKLAAADGKTTRLDAERRPPFCDVGCRVRRAGARFGDDPTDDCHG